MKNTIWMVGVAAALTTLPLGALAQTDDAMSGEQIQERVWGHRVQGAMTNGQAYDEVYRDDGKIEGDGYEGQAKIVDDRMCFDYGSDEVTCYGVRSDGDDRIQWLDGDDVVGEGELSDAP